MSDKQHAVELLDRLGPGQLAAVVHLLKVMVQKERIGVHGLNEEDRHALRASEEYFRNCGLGAPFGRVVAAFGFTNTD